MRSSRDSDKLKSSHFWRQISAATWKLRTATVRITTGTAPIAQSVKTQGNTVVYLRLLRKLTLYWKKYITSQWKKTTFYAHKFSALNTFFFMSNNAK